MVLTRFQFVTYTAALYSESPSVNVEINHVNIDGVQIPSMDVVAAQLPLEIGGRFRMLKLIGEGSYGTCRSGMSNGNVLT